jgi:hypothetical protein
MDAKPKTKLPAPADQLVVDALAQAARVYRRTCV